MLYGAYERQPLGGATPICEQTSYVPVPVVEAQAVLTK